MLEYEYSFKVKDLSPYIKYCEENGFEKTEESFQTRILYKNQNKILARITTVENNGVKNNILDFKDEYNSEKILKESKESIPLEIKADDMNAVISILDILKYSKYKTLVRKRIVYKKDNVIFEMDNYTKPEVMYVVAVEGEKEQVDRVYNDIKNIINIINS